MILILKKKEKLPYEKAVLGSGLVGSVIANDLSTFCDVTCIDISDKNLSRTNDSITKSNVTLEINPILERL